jgi:hypothetical protein
MRRLDSQGVPATTGVDVGVAWGWRRGYSRPRNTDGGNAEIHD